METGCSLRTTRMPLLHFPRPASRPVMPPYLPLDGRTFKKIKEIRNEIGNLAENYMTLYSEDFLHRARGKFSNPVDHKSGILKGGFWWGFLKDIFKAVLGSQ